MLTVSDVRRLACDALRNKAEQSITKEASSGKENVIVDAKDIPVWLEAELTDRGFILNRYARTNCSDVIEIFWGVIKE